MLTTLMDISEAETGTMKLNVSRVELAKLAKEVTDLYEDAADDAGVSLHSTVPSELTVPAGLFATLADDYCAVDALLQFARAPWAERKGDGWVVGDLRYDQEPGLGLAEVEVGPGRDQCPRLPAPWTPPRDDLLNGP